MTIEALNGIKEKAKREAITAKIRESLANQRREIAKGRRYETHHQSRGRIKAYEHVLRLLERADV